MIVNKLFLNHNYGKNPNLSLVKARNVVFDDDFEYLINEDGFEKLHEFAEDICGIIAIPTGYVVFTTDGNGTDSIYKADDSSSLLILQGDFGFSTAHPIEGVYKYNNLGQLIIIFNDTVNPLRTLNIDDTGITSVDNAIINNHIKLFPDYNIPIYTYITDQKGNLPKGVYQFIISYYINNHDRLNWTTPSQPIYIGKYRKTAMNFTSSYNDGHADINTVYFVDNYQLNSETETDQGITITLDQLDTRYNKYKLACIHRTDTSTKVYDFGDFERLGTDYIKSHHIINLPLTELSLDEVTIPNIAYSRVNSITSSMDRLVLGGTNTNGLIDYQKFANNIKVNYDVVQMGLNDTLAEFLGFDELFDLSIEVFKTPILDEVYALYIGLIGTDGANKGWFHIPGRAAANALETSSITHTDIDTYNASFGRANAEQGKLYIDKYFKAFNTADPYTSSTRKLAYWENKDEYYPNIDQFDIWDVDINGVASKIPDVTLRGMPVRHHKMPDFGKLYDNTDVGFVPNKGIALHFSDIKFPKEILDQIQGFQIGYATRDNNNMTVLGTYPYIRNDFYKPYVAPSEGGIFNLFSNDSQNYIRYNDLGLLEFKPALKNPYLKGVYVYAKSLYSSTGLTNQQRNSVIQIQMSSINQELFNVLDYKYLPRDNSATTPSNKGREESLILTVHDSSRFDDSETMLLCALKANVDTLYYPFNKQKIALTECFTKVVDGLYNYDNAATMGIYNMMPIAINVRGFDGFLTTYDSILYRGDQTLKLGEDSDAPIIAREDGDEDDDMTTVINTFKVWSNSIFNYDFKTREEKAEEIEYKKDRSWIANLFGGNDVEFEYTSTFPVDPAGDDGISYNRMYSFPNNVVGYFAYDFTNVFVLEHNNRIARSAIQSKESLVDNWRYFSALEYYETVKHRGPITKVIGHGELLLIHHEHSLYVAKMKDKLSIEGGDAYIGTSDIFDREPDELIVTPTGKAGLQSKFGFAISDYGYTFVDSYDKTIYNYANNSVDRITDVNVREFIRKYLTTSEGNPLLQDDIIIGVDDKKKRLIITNIGDTPFTLSFSYEVNNVTWVSFHDYIPALMFNNRTGTYAVNRDNLKEIYRFNTGPKGTYFGTKYESYIDVLINENPKTDKMLHSIGMVSDINTKGNRIDKVFFYNWNKCSKIYDILEFTNIGDYDRIRFTNDFWWYDLIRDYTNNNLEQSIVNDFGTINNAAILLNKAWYELSDMTGKHFIVRLIVNNDRDMCFKDLVYNVSTDRR